MNNSFCLYIYIFFFILKKKYLFYYIFIDYLLFAFYLTMSDKLPIIFSQDEFTVFSHCLRSFLNELQNDDNQNINEIKLKQFANIRYGFFEETDKKKYTMLEKLLDFQIKKLIEAHVAKQKETDGVFDFADECNQLATDCIPNSHLPTPVIEDWVLATLSSATSNENAKSRKLLSKKEALHMINSWASELDLNIPMGYVLGLSHTYLLFFCFWVVCNNNSNKWTEKDKMDGKLEYVKLFYECLLLTQPNLPYDENKIITDSFIIRQLIGLTYAMRKIFSNIGTSHPNWKKIYNALFLIKNPVSTDLKFIERNADAYENLICEERV